MTNDEDIIDKALAKIAEIDQQIGPLEAERSRLRAFVNQACEISGREPVFPDVDASAVIAAIPPVFAPAPGAPSVRPGSIHIRSDQFFSVPLAGAVRSFLELRKAAGLGPATTEEIHEGLARGGFSFPSKDVDNQKRGLQVSLSKNTTAFRRLPNGLYGLAEWYAR